MWKIFSEIKKKLWCHTNFCLVFISSSDIYFYTNLLWMLKSHWRHWVFHGWHNILAKPSISRPMKSPQHPPRFHPEVFPNLYSHPLFSALSIFHPWWHGLPWLRFHSLKTKHENRGGGGAMKERENGIVQRERPKSKLTTGCEGVTLASLLTLFHSFFPLFCPYFYCSVHPLWRESWTSVYTVVCWNEEEHSAQTFIPANLRADWKLSKVTISCKNRTTYTFKTRT